LEIIFGLQAWVRGDPTGIDALWSQSASSSSIFHVFEITACRYKSLRIIHTQDFLESWVGLHQFRRGRWKFVTMQVS